MPEDKPQNRPTANPDPQSADARLLFGDAPSKSPSPSTGPPPQAAGESPSGSGDEFALVDAPDWAADWAPAQFPSAPVARDQAGPKGEPRAKSKPEQAKASAPDPATLVEETWSRWNEWGSNLIVVGAWSVVLMLLIYFMFGQEYYGLAFVLLIVGLAVAVVLSYPMLITLERPVRVTPEQALRDYYAALSHHVPHLRRMWLLLSTAGRVSTAFGSFEGFKGYWREQLARLRKGHAGPLTPLVFQVVNFKSEKSAGKARIDATYTLNVSVRGQRTKGAVHSIPGAMALVRGPDNMWYLESGTLPREKPVRTLIEPAE